MTAKCIVIAGYATLDYVVQLAQPFSGTGTATCHTGWSDAWPRAGGAPLYAARRIAAAGHRGIPLTWVGDDADGERYLDACRRARVRCDAIARSPHVTTPRCLLLYQPVGTYGCLLDAGTAAAPTLTGQQRDVLRAADHLCIAAGPPAATAAILDACPATTGLSWIAKLDEFCFPADLRRRLTTRADLIFCNTGERAFVDGAGGGPRRAGQIVVETLGSAGVRIDDPAGRRTFSTEPVLAHDTTGAGDTLAGEVIARHIAAATPVDEAVRHGMAAARALLASRVPAAPTRIEALSKDPA